MTSATVVLARTSRAAPGGVGEDPLGVRADRAVEQLDQLEDRDLAGLAGANE